jgi:hypothetical protein
MGLDINNSILYVAGQEYYECGYLDYCASDSMEIYLDFNGVSGSIFGLAYDSGDIWLACGSGYPVRKFDSGGTMVYYLENSLIPYARGLEFDPSGFVWVSDPVNDLIYKVDLETALERSTWGRIKVLE